jgi:hypothetical protein
MGNRILDHSPKFGGVCLYLAHLMALGIYGAVLGFYELSRISARTFNAKYLAVTAAILVSPALAVLGYVALSGTKVGDAGTEWVVMSKVLGVLYLMNGYNPTLAIASFLITLVLFYILYKNRSISFVAEGKWIACGLLVLFILMPFNALGSAYDDTRIASVALLILPAFLIVSSKTTIIRLLPPITFSAIALINSGQVASLWLSHRSDYDALKSSFALIQRGAFVLVAQSETALYDWNGPLLRYAPVLAVHYSGAFVPSLFSIPGMYVVHTSEQLRRFEITNPFFYDPIPFQLLRKVENGGDVYKYPSFVRCWMHDYDYLYLIGQPDQNPMPSRLAPLAVSDRFALYEIKKDPPSTPIPQSTFDMQRIGSGCASTANDFESNRLRPTGQHE